MILAIALFLSVISSLTGCIAQNNNRTKRHNTPPNASAETLRNPQNSQLLSVGKIQAESKTISIGSEKFEVKVVRVPLGSYRIKVGLAQGRVGATEALHSIAQRYGAVAAINGCYFNAYTNSPIKPPYHTLITDGHLVHIGNTGTLLGFDGKGNYRMERVRVEIRGRVEQEREWWLSDWYAYFVNHPPETRDAAIIYDRFWCQATTPNEGVQVVIRDGQVERISQGAQQIPQNGYVLLLAGQEKQMGKRFKIRQRCEFKVIFRSDMPSFWETVQEAIGCGPRLIANGNIVVNPTEEGFSHPKVLTLAGARSAVGLTEDGYMLFVTCSNATIRQLAKVMKTLGAKDAMNLDGGASSGLWVNGVYLTKPGRQISNALLILRR